LESDSRVACSLAFNAVLTSDPEQIEWDFSLSQLVDDRDGWKDVATCATAGDDKPKYPR